ncbi:putative ribonuclease H-like domain-containing protein [Tanacetum coccineum]
MFKDIDFDDLDDLVDEGMDFVQEKDAENQGKIGDDDTEAVNTAGEGVSTAAPRTPPTTTTVFDDEDVTMAMAWTLIKMKEEKSKEKGVAIKDVEDYSRPIRSITTLQPLPTIDPKDKERDAKIALRLQAELDAELRVERERQEEASKVAIAEMFDEVQARIDANYELAARMTQEEQEKYIIEERARLLAEFFERRKKQLAAERAEAIRSKPPTKTQQQKRIQDFTPMYSEKEAEKSAKRLKRVTGSYATQNSSKKPKVMKSAKDVIEEEAAEYEKEKEEHRLSLKIISNDDSEVNYEPLSRKFPILQAEEESTMAFELIKFIIVEKRYPLIKEMLCKKMLELELRDQFNENDSSGSELFNNVFDSRSSDGDDNQTNDRFKKDNGYHAVPPPLTGIYMPSLADLSFIGVSDDDEDIFQSNDLQATDKPSFKKIEFTNARNESVKPKQVEKPMITTQNPKRINHQNKFVPSAVLKRSRKVQVSTAKKNSLRAITSTSTFRPINTATHTNRVNVSKLRTNAFHKSHSPIIKSFYKPTSPNTKISNKKVNIVRVNDVNTAWQTTVSAVKGNGVTVVKALAGKSTIAMKELRYLTVPMFPELKGKGHLIDYQELMEVLLLLNIVPSGNLTLLFAKATIDESKLWHKRLGHVNLKTMNKLVKGNLVRGLPIKTFENDHTCVACQKGKQHRWTRPNWLFDIDSLTNSMNYQPVTAGNQTNKNEGPQEANGNTGLKQSVDAGQSEEKNVSSQQYVVFPLWSSISSSYKSSDENDTADDSTGESPIQKPTSKNEQALKNNISGKATKASNTNIFNTVSTPVNAVSASRTYNDAGSSFVTLGGSFLDDPHMSDLEDTAEVQNTGIFGSAYDDEDLDTYNLLMLIKLWVQRLILTTWNLQLLIEAIRLFLAYASFMNFLVYQMDVKSAFLYGTIEEEVYASQPLGFMDLEFQEKVYKVEKALYGLHQDPRAWYDTLSTYLLDNRFFKGKIDKTLFIKRVKGDILVVQVYVDDIIFGSTKKSLCTDFEQIMHKRFQMSSTGELTFFLGLQVKQKEDGTLLLALVCLIPEAWIKGRLFVYRFRGLLTNELIEALFEEKLYGTMCINAVDYTKWILRMEYKSCQVMKMD